MDDDARPKPGALQTFHGLDLGTYNGFAAAVTLPDGAICDMNPPTFTPFWNARVMARTLWGGGPVFRPCIRPCIRLVSGALAIVSAARKRAAQHLSAAEFNGHA